MKLWSGSNIYVLRAVYIIPLMLRKRAIEDLGEDLRSFVLYAKFINKNMHSIS